MKFLVDESVEYSIVLFLRKEGYDVISVAENYPSLRDTEIIDTAFKEKRILITNDKDFGELIVRYQIPHYGVILFRLNKESSASKVRRLKIILKKFEKKIEQNFIIIKENSIRIKKQEIKKAL